MRSAEQQREEQAEEHDQDRQRREIAQRDGYAGRPRLDEPAGTGR